MGGTGWRERGVGCLQGINLRHVLLRVQKRCCTDGVNFPESHTRG